MDEGTLPETVIVTAILFDGDQFTVTVRPHGEETLFEGMGRTFERAVEEARNGLRQYIFNQLEEV